MQARQIVSPTNGFYGFLPEFGHFGSSLISVRSVVRIYPGPYSEETAPRDLGRSGGVFHFPKPQGCVDSALNRHLPTVQQGLSELFLVRVLIADQDGLGVISRS